MYNVPSMVHRFRYSEWDGTQDIPPLDPDDILAGLTDDLMNFGDLQHALRNLLQRGMKNPLGQRLQGLRDLLQQLRQRRRQVLDRYDLSSVFEDIEKRLEEIMGLETDTLNRRLDEANKQIANMSPEDMARMKQMLRDLNKMLSEKMAGGEPDFQGFMQKYGDLFGDNPPQSLDELIAQMQQSIAAMQSLLGSLPPEMRRQLHDLLMDKVDDPELQRELSELAINLDI